MTIADRKFDAMIQAEKEYKDARDAEGRAVFPGKQEVTGTMKDEAADIEAMKNGRACVLAPGLHVKYFGVCGEAWDGVVSTVHKHEDDGSDPQYGKGMVDIVSEDQRPEWIRSAFNVPRCNAFRRAESTGHYYIVDQDPDNRSHRPASQQYERRIDQLVHVVKELGKQCGQNYRQYIELHNRQIRMYATDKMTPQGHTGDAGKE